VRNRAGLVLPGVASVAVGVVLMAIPVVLVLTGSVIGLVWTVLLWVGFGEVVIGAVLLTLAAMARPTAPVGAADADTDAAHVVDDGEPADVSPSG
jgi:hypothetical protein